jgi:hypothetical protein
MHCAVKFLSFLILLVLPACVPMSMPSPSSSKAQMTAKSKGDGGSPKIAPMVAPPGLGERAPLPGQTGREKTASGLPIMQPARGLNVSNLFAERIANPEKRTERVEVAVQELRNDFDSVLPSLLRLVAIEKDIDSLVVQLESLVLENPDFAAPAAEEPVASTGKSIDMSASSPAVLNKPARPVAVAAKTSKSVAAGGLALNKIRTGVHADKARLVIDVNGPSTYTHDLDAAEGLLVISVPQARWAGSVKGSKVKNPIIKSWSVDKLNDGDGAMIVVELVRGAKVLSTYALGKNGAKSHRIVFDLK